MTLSDLWPTFQGRDNIQRQITRLIVSRVWSTHWFRFQWPWVTLNLDFKVTEMLSTYCVRYAKFLLCFSKCVNEPLFHLSQVINILYDERNCIGPV